MTKRRFTAVLIALLALGVSGLVHAAPVVPPNVTLDIPQGCVVDVSTGTWTTYSGANDPCDPDHDCVGLGCTTHHLCPNHVTFRGHHNQSVMISVAATPFDDGSGNTLRTWVEIDGTEYQVGVGTWPKLVPQTWTDGDWSFDVTVGFERDGYADAAGKYTATVTVTCGGYII